MGKNPPVCTAGSYTLKYMLSLNVGSGPSSCRYSSAGSSRRAISVVPLGCGAVGRVGRTEHVGQAGLEVAHRIVHDVGPHEPDGFDGAPVDDLQRAGDVGRVA